MKSSKRGLKNNIISISLVTVLMMTVYAFTSCAYMYISDGKKYSQTVKEMSELYQVEESMIYAIIKVESNFDPNAKSNKGALGLMQIMPKTAEFVADMYGIDYRNENQLYEVELNIKLGTAYFSYLQNKFKSQELAILSYNGGEGNVTKWMKEQGKKNNLEVPFKETENYLKKINKAYKIFKKLLL